MQNLHGYFEQSSRSRGRRAIARHQRLLPGNGPAVRKYPLSGGADLGYRQAIIASGVGIQRLNFYTTAYFSMKSRFLA